MQAWTEKIINITSFYFYIHKMCIECPTLNTRHTFFFISFYSLFWFLLYILLTVLKLPYIQYSPSHVPEYANEVGKTWNLTWCHYMIPRDRGNFFRRFKNVITYTAWKPGHLPGNMVSWGNGSGLNAMIHRWTLKGFSTFKRQQHMFHVKIWERFTQLTV